MLVMEGCCRFIVQVILGVLGSEFEVYFLESCLVMIEADLFVCLCGIFSGAGCNPGYHTQVPGPK